MKKNLMLCGSCFLYCFPDAPQSPCKGKRQQTPRRLPHCRKERLIPLSRYPQNQTLPQKPRQKPPIPQLAHQMRTNTKAALLFLLSR